MFDLVDQYQRKFSYLRLSVTDRCGFKCVYCLPNGYVAPPGKEPDLSSDEIRRLVTAFATLGVSKVRLTGGEPTIRRDIVELVHLISRIPGIKKTALTTNGSRLKELARPLHQAGLTAVNVSIDSLDRKRFSEITGTDRLEAVLAGVESALSAGFETVKVNAVLLRDWNDHEVAHFIEWVRDRPISVRFIELMRTGNQGDFFNYRHLTAGKIQLELLKSGWIQNVKHTTDGPAVVYRHPQYQGTMGLIAPYSRDFCKGCNRLRVSSTGGLRLCLFGEKDESLRPYLTDDSQHDELVARIQTLVMAKPISHHLHEGNYGNTWNLAGIGG